MKNQFKRILALLLAVVMILGVLPSAFAANVEPFKDVQDNAWYATYVQAVYKAGLMQGVSANKFNPDGTSTRAQVVTVLYRIAGQPAVGEAATFTDLTADWYANPVAWAQQNNIVNGISATKFGPNNNVTREQLVTMIHRYYGKPAGTGDLNAFSDAAKVSEYARDAFAWAIGEGIINGSNGKLNPQGLATRAQFAKIIWLSIPEPCEHVWDEGVVTKEPTCVASGIKTYTCTICKETEKEPIAATGEHKLVETITLAPACESYGVKTVTCTVCGATSTESIDPTGHTFVDGFCTVCGAPEPSPAKSYILTAALVDGDEVIIYNAGNGKAMVAAMTGFYLAGADMAPVDNMLETSDPTLIWTVKVNEDGTYTFVNGENVLGADTSTNAEGKTFTNLYIEEGHKAKWNLSTCNSANSSFFITNAEMTAKYGSVYVEWYAAKTAFSAYDTSTDRATEKDFGFQFYALDATPPTPHEHTYVDGICTGCGAEDPDYVKPPVPGDEFVRVTELREGAEIIVVCDSRNIALGADYGTSYYNPGVAVEPVDGVIKNSDATIVWTVGKEGDFYTLSYNGQKLGMGTEYTSMSLGGVNYKWELREAANEGTFYLVNLDRDPSQAYYMQWYEAKTYWSGYYNLNDELMALSFYEKGATPPTPHEHTYVDGVCTACGEKDPNYVPPTPPTPDEEVYTRVNELKEGDEIIIVCDAKSIALGADYAGSFYNPGVAVEPVDGVIKNTDSTIVWTVGKEGEYYTFSYEGQKIAMGTGYTSMPLGEVNYKWIVTPAENEGTFYVGNPDRDPSKGIYYMQWYEEKNYWSAYHTLNDELMALAFYAKNADDNGDPQPHEHAWGEGEVTTEPTCGAEGVKTYTCECGETKTEAIPATGEHTYEEGYCTVCQGKDPNYVPPTPPTPDEEVYTRVNELKEGDEIIIICDSRSIALGADYAGSFYNPGVAVEVVDGKITTDDTTIVWTVGKEGEYYTFSYEGQKIAMGTGYTSMPLGEVNYKWIVTPAENEGTFYVGNPDRDPSKGLYYMQWYEEKNYWSAYHTLNDELMALAFYAKGVEDNGDPQPHEHAWGEGEVTTAPTCGAEGVKTFTCECGETKTEAIPATGEHTYEEGYCTVCQAEDPNYVPPVDPPVDGEVYTRVNELKEGDQIIIVCDAKGIALSATYGTNYNNGVEVEVVDGKITTDDTTIVWTVGKEGEYYTFSYEGQKIAMGTQYSSMPLGEVNYKWIVTPAENEGTFYVGNPDRDPAKGIYYMEWYESKGYWSAYHKLDDALMAMAFYAKGVQDNGGNDDDDTDKPCEHVWNEGIVTKEATCAEIGAIEYACTICGATKTESIPATGEHTYEEGTCTGCDAKDPNYVPPTPGEATAVDFSSLQDGDVIAIVITANPEMTGKDYVLLNNFGADAYSNAAVFEGTFTESMYWTVKIVDGKVYLVNGEIGLSILDNNNGLRANGEAMVIEMDESGYLKMTDPNGNVRYIGVYDNNGGDVSKVATPNIRSYKNYTNNTKGQTTTIYKIG